MSGANYRGAELLHRTAFQKIYVVTGEKHSEKSCLAMRAYSKASGRAKPAIVAFAVVRAVSPRRTELGPAFYLKITACFAPNFSV